MTSEHLLFDHSLVWIMVPVCHVRMGSTGVWAPVWTASGMGHWKRLIKIPGSTDYYYCINHTTCSTHVYYCPFYVCYYSWYVLHDHVTGIPCYTFWICYTPCGNTLFMYSILCIAYILLYVYVADFITVYAHHNSMQTALLYMHNTIVWLCCIPVSYTHLTLPTIYSV